MVPFQVSQYILCILPSVLVSVDGAQPTVRSSGFITAEEHPIHLRRCTTMVFARLLSSHLPGQRLFRYSARKDLRQESNGMFLPPVGATALCHDPNVWLVRRGRAARLAIDDIVIYIRCHHIVPQLIPGSKRLLGLAGSLGLMDKGWAA